MPPVKSGIIAIAAAISALVKGEGVVNILDSDTISKSVIQALNTAGFAVVPRELSDNVSAALYREVSCDFNNIVTREMMQDGWKSAIRAAKQEQAL